ncbi:MAG TPA: D-2-hydroxyacid dehydrogenase [Pseudolabrys sp.]|nr:D-2-hydroxyacid dehydrogenase [Pseudolabrys sp.]
MTNVLILTDLPAPIRKQYVGHLSELFPQLKVNDVEHRSKVGPYIGDTDVLMTFGPIMADHVIEDAKKLRWIQALGTGVDRLADSPALRKGTIVTNIRGIHGPPVSEAAIAYMFALARDMPRTFRQQETQQWIRWPMQLLDDKTVGILGVGLIAEALAPRCKALGMRVIGISSGTRDVPNFDRMVHRDDLVKIAHELDFLVLLTPLSAQTKGMVGAEVFKAMKQTAYLVNVARGGVADEDALIAALKSGEIAGAALDVFSEEPLPAGHPLWSTPNLHVYPHLGGFFDRYEERALPTIAHNMRCFLAGDYKSMHNVVVPAL